MNLSVVGKAGFETDCDEIRPGRQESESILKHPVKCPNNAGSRVQ